MTDISLSNHQNDAIRSVLQWFKSVDRAPYFKLMGYAGTGKTTIARTIAQQIHGEVKFAAFTGKAAVVLRSKGCHGASTIHSLIYKVVEDDDGTIHFKLNESALTKTKLVIIDECSMVGSDIGEDLLSFDVPILVLGDPAQLPPIGGEGFFTSGEPDFMLTEIHRQATENPIIALSMAAREGVKIPLGKYNDSLVIKESEYDFNEVLSADQVICGMNKTRVLQNQVIRELRGFTDPHPMVGERLICLRNDREKGLLNGSLWDLAEIKKRYTRSMTCKVQAIDFGMPEKPISVYLHDYFFLGREKEIDFKELARYDHYTFGYSITCHKSQGSEFNNLVVFDESDVFRADKRRWLYTAITRASEKLTLVV